MKKIALALAASLASAPAMAGVYVNVESNASYTGNDYTSRTTDLHVGYEGTSGDIGYYVQAGPGFVHTDSADDTETEISGKAGVTYAVNEDLGVYGELAGITNGEDSDGDEIIDWSAKLGAKFTF